MRNRYFARNNDDREVPVLNTSSLPDLIFTVLFFFMIVTHMREVELKVRYQVPQGTELQKLGHKSSVVQVYVGRLGSVPGGSDDFVVQLNDRVVTIDEIRPLLDEERARMSAEDQARMTVSIKADRDVPMGLISDVKQALQQSYALRVNYSATAGKETINNQK